MLLGAHRRDPCTTPTGHPGPGVLRDAERHRLNPGVVVVLEPFWPGGDGQVTVAGGLLRRSMRALCRDIRRRGWGERRRAYGRCRGVRRGGRFRARRAGLARCPRGGCAAGRRGWGRRARAEAAGCPSPGPARGAVSLRTAL